jgi:hypothetical protein
VSEETKIEGQEDEEPDVEGHAHDLGAQDLGAQDLGAQDLGANEPRANEPRPSDL